MESSDEEICKGCMTGKCIISDEVEKLEEFFLQGYRIIRVLKKK